MRSAGLGNLTWNRAPPPPPVLSSDDPKDKTGTSSSLFPSEFSPPLFISGLPCGMLLTAAAAQSAAAATGEIKFLAGVRGELEALATPVELKPGVDDERFPRGVCEMDLRGCRRKFARSAASCALR
jgi:hypothetical protein